jgi:hypothetical protein
LQTGNRCRGKASSFGSLKEIRTCGRPFEVFLLGARFALYERGRNSRGSSGSFHDRMNHHPSPWMFPMMNFRASTPGYVLRFTGCIRCIPEPSYLCLGMA